MDIGLEYCELCPRACGANRAAGYSGACGASDRLVVARAALHHWEEPPLSGTRGSGTVFFANCSLRCIYCQNKAISQGGFGKHITPERLAEIFLELQNAGAHNINLVTPAHYVPHICTALTLARASGLVLPIVYNTSGYETVATIEALASFVDIWLTDWRYSSTDLAQRYSDAEDYPDVVQAALQQMLRQTAPWQLDSAGILQSGIIVRHLLLPGHLVDAIAAVSSVFALAQNRVCYSLMNQYTPNSDIANATGTTGKMGTTGAATQYPNLEQAVCENDYEALIEHALNLGITNSFMQEGGTASASFIPAFDCTGT